MSSQLKPPSSKHGEQKKVRKKSGRSSSKSPSPNPKRSGGSRKLSIMEAADLEDDPKLKEHLDTLKRKSVMPETEIRERYVQFLSDCPDGLLSKAKFIELSGDSLGEQVDDVADAIFKVFDEDRNGKLDFVEYILAVSSTQMNTPEDKLKWIFKMYDKDCSGSIETAELQEMFETLFETTGVQFDESQLEVLVSDVMQTLDKDGNGNIDMKEFVEGSMKTPFMMTIFCPSEEDQ